MLLRCDVGRIIGAIDHLKFPLMRMPTVDESAIEAGIIPSEAEHLVYKLTSQTGWFNPTPEIISKARTRLGEVLVCAARIRQKLVAKDGKSEEFDYDDDAAVVEEAKSFLKDYPQLLPELTEDGENVVVWSQEALRFLGDNYVPEGRERPYVGIVSPRYR